MPAPRIAFLTRYPVKGLSPEPLDRVTLTAQAHFPGDRLFAIENGPSGFDASTPVHQPKFKFMVLMRMPTLARIASRYDAATGILSLTCDGERVSGDINTTEGRASLEGWLGTRHAAELRGPPRILAAPAGFRFMDSRSGFVSLLNLASLRSLAARMGRKDIDPVRFRANIGIEGLPPWGEFDLVGKELTIGGARLRVLKRIERCAATHADPGKGLRDLDIVGALLREFGHTDCGIYAEVLEGGDIAMGDTVET